MKHLILIFLCIFLFSACSTKRQYFKPDHINKDLDKSESLNSTIIDWNIFVAKLKNNQVIFKNHGVIKNFKLEKNYMLLNMEDNEFFVADNDGNLKIYNLQNQEVYSYKFDASVVSIASNGDDMALVLANNTIVLLNRTLGIKFSQTLSPSIAQDNRIAAPIFLDNIIVYPTLDGRIIVISKNDYRILKDVVISAEDFFNNIIYLNVIDDKLIAASAKKVIVVTQNQTFYLYADIKDIAVNHNNIFIFDKDGNIIKTDLNLKKITEKKLEFAIFTKANIYNDYLYIFEKTGYLIKSDLNLDKMEIYELSNAVDKMLFIDNRAFYYNDKILKFK